MSKLLAIFTSLIFVLVLATTVSAAGLSVRLEQPKTPTSTQDLKITFVSLDINNNPVTVKCFKKGPGDVDFSQFGTDFNLSAGGNSDSCIVNSSVMSASGVYQFYVSANNGSETVNSTVVSVDFKSQKPGTPKSYSKEKINSCDYRIKFKSDADGGITKKILIYRSDSKSFSLSGSTQVGTVSINSDQEGEYISNTPDCNKEYYFAIRAADDYGNLSDPIGDSFTTVVTKEGTANTTTTTTAANRSTTTSNTGALVTNNSQVGGGEILGEASDSANEATDSSSQVLGDESATPDSEQPSEDKGFWSKNWLWIIIVVALALAAFAYSKRPKQSN